MSNLTNTDEPSVTQLLSQVATSNEQMAPRKKIVHGIEKLIEENRLSPEIPLPTSREMMKLFGVSIATVQAAMDDLVRKGLLNRKPRLGTFVNHPQSTKTDKPQAIKRVCVVDSVGLKNAKSGYMGRCYLAAILDAAHRTNYEVVLESDRTLMNEIEKGKSLRWREMSSIILTSPTVSTLERAQQLADDDFPVLLLNARSDNPKIGCVYTDNIIGSYEATKRLIELGHERVCFLSPSSLDRHVSYSDRLEGCRRALVQAGLPEPTVLEWQQAEALRAILCKSNEKRATAILDIGIGSPTLFHLLDLFGLRVPEDISVVCYDHALLATEDGKTIAAVEQPIEEMVDRAFSLIPNLRVGGFALRLPQIFYEGGTIGQAKTS